MLAAIRANGTNEQFWKNTSSRHWNRQKMSTPEPVLTDKVTSQSGLEKFGKRICLKKQLPVI
jgi:hypothetical protein